MHTYTGKFGTRFNHNLDMSGGIEIVTPNGSVNVQWGDIMDFVAEYLRREKIAAIESADSIDLLGLQRSEWDYRVHQK